MLIEKYLEVVVKQRGSDLHISAGLPPVVRIDGQLQRMDVPALKPEEVELLLFPMLNKEKTPILWKSVLHSYLLWPPYIEKVFFETSNIAQFVKEFEISYSREEASFGDCWRIFGREFDGTTEKLSQENSLQRSFVKYINEGGDFGHGYGILLYDGEKRKIIKE